MFDLNIINFERGSKFEWESVHENISKDVPNSQVKGYEMWEKNILVVSLHMSPHLAAADRVS